MNSYICVYNILRVDTISIRISFINIKESYWLKEIFGAKFFIYLRYYGFFGLSH